MIFSDDADFELEIVRDGNAWWLGCDRLRASTVDELHRCVAISSTGESGMEHFVINGTGRAIARRPALAEEVARAVFAGKPFTIRDDRVALL